jgi:hypothetical protein
MQMKRGAYFNKSNLNFVIDALMLLTICGIIGIGFMIKYVLLTGQQKWEEFGANLDQTLLGMDRHEWGSVHLYLGFVFLGMFVLHIIFHWNMIGCMYRRLINSIKVRRIVAVPFLSICLMIMVIPFALKPEMKVETGSDIESAPDHEHRNRSERTVDIRGYMTIADICSTHNIPSQILKEKLGLPPNALDNTRLNILRKHYNIRMSDIEKIINEYHAASESVVKAF